MTDASALAACLADLRAGRLDAASARCEALRRRAPDDPALMQMAAAIALRRGRAEDAARLAEASLDARPDHPPTLVVAAQAARALGRHERALALFQRASRLAPERAEPAFHACAMLLEAGDARAEPMLGALAARFPREAAGWEEVGRVLLAAGRRDAALACLTRAGRTAPSFGNSMTRGLILREMGRPGEAADAFTDAAGREPGSARAWFLLGACRQDSRDLPAAAAAYRRAAAADPALAEAHLNLGTVAQDMGDLDGAKAAYGRAVRARPDAFGRAAQAMTTSPRGELWLDLAALRRHLAG